MHDLIVPASLSIDPVWDFRQLTAFPFMVNALEAGTLVAVMAGVVGWFMVLRRETFAGHTMSLMAFPGAAGALLLGLPAAAGYFVFCAVAAVALGAGAGPAGRDHGGQASAITGTVQAFGLACGFLFLSLYHGVLANYEALLFGNILGITRSQVLVLALATVLTLAFFAVVGRPLLFSSIDEPMARARGLPTRALTHAFLLVLGLAVAATAQITGVLLVLALLVAPAATAQQITARIGVSLALTIALGVLITWIGLALQYFFNYPAGFYITTVAFVMYLLARLGRVLIDHPSLVRRHGGAVEAGAAV